MSNPKRARPATEEINPKHEDSVRDYLAAPVIRPEHRESDFTRLIEQQTAKIPSHVFLFLSISSMVASLTCAIAGQERASRFIGMWSPTLLIIGVYNKLVKIAGTR